MRPVLHSLTQQMEEEPHLFLRGVFKDEKKRGIVKLKYNHKNEIYIWEYIFKDNPQTTQNIKIDKWMSRQRVEYEFYLQLHACWSCRSRVVYDTWCKICMMDNHNGQQLEKDLDSPWKSTQNISARDIPAILYLINKSENIHHTVGSIVPVPGYIGINRKIKGNRKKKGKAGWEPQLLLASLCFLSVEVRGPGPVMLLPSRFLHHDRLSIQTLS